MACTVRGDAAVPTPVTAARAICRRENRGGADIERVASMRASIGSVMSSSPSCRARRLLLVHLQLYRWLAPWRLARVCASGRVDVVLGAFTRAMHKRATITDLQDHNPGSRSRALRQITAQHDQAARATTHTRERQRDRPTERLTRPTAARPLHDRPSEMLPDAVQTLTLTSRALAHTHTSMFATSCRRACALSRRTTRGTPLCPRATRQAGPTSEAGTTTTIGIPKKAAPPSDAGKRPGS